MRGRVLVFGLLCAAQLAVPASSIWQAERVLAEGRLLRFRTAPVDPADLVRGRYVALRFEAVEGPRVGPASLLPGQRAHVLLEEDAEGFARISGVTARRPEGGTYFDTRVEAIDDERVRIRFPVDRLYLPERKALAVERAWQAAAGRNGWAEIRVHQGRALIERLSIEGVPVLEHVERASALP